MLLMDTDPRMPENARGQRLHDRRARPIADVKDPVRRVAPLPMQIENAAIDRSIRTVKPDAFRLQPLDDIREKMLHAKPDDLFVVQPAARGNRFLGIMLQRIALQRPAPSHRDCGDTSRHQQAVAVPLDPALHEKIHAHPSVRQFKGRNAARQPPADHGAVGLEKGLTRRVGSGRHKVGLFLPVLQAFATQQRMPHPGI